MKRAPFQNLPPVLFVLCAMTAAALLPSACSRDSEYTPVNFSTRVEVAAPASPLANGHKLRVAVAAMVSPKETFHYYNELLRYIGKKVDRDIQMIQRKTYEEINELFPQDKIDMAFVCTGPYATDRDTYAFEAIATPVIRGKPYYQSYLIVHKDSPFHEIVDIRQRTFAFTDPDSNTGSLVPRFWLHEIGESPSTFFKSTVYTYSHDNSIMAVAKGLVDAAAVDGHKWEYFQKRSAYFSFQTRIIKKSKPFGSPPLVVASVMNGNLKRQVQEAVLDMHNTEDGRAILRELMIDQFIEPEAHWYEPVREMAAALRSEKG